MTSDYCKLESSDLPIIEWIYWAIFTTFPLYKLASLKLIIGLFELFRMLYSLSWLCSPCLMLFLRCFDINMPLIFILPPRYGFRESQCIELPLISKLYSLSFSCTRLRISIIGIGECHLPLLSIWLFSLFSIWFFWRYLLSLFRATWQIPLGFTWQLIAFLILFNL